MGLDMYLTVQRKKGLTKEPGVRGACGGLFGIAPKTEGDHEEVGYWRKAYELDDIISRVQGRTDDDNAVELPLSVAQVEAIIKEIEWNISEVEEDTSDYCSSGWDLEDMRHSLAVFTQALSDATINGDEFFYMNWY